MCQNVYTLVKVTISIKINSSLPICLVHSIPGSILFREISDIPIALWEVPSICAENIDICDVMLD